MVQLVRARYLLAVQVNHAIFQTLLLAAQRLRLKRLSASQEHARLLHQGQHLARRRLSERRKLLRQLKACFLKYWRFSWLSKLTVKNLV